MAGFWQHMSRTLLTSKLNKQISARLTELKQTVGRAHMDGTHGHVYSHQQFVEELLNHHTQKKYNRKSTFRIPVCECVFFLLKMTPLEMFSCLENISLDSYIIQLTHSDNYQ